MRECTYTRILGISVTAEVRQSSLKCVNSTRRIQLKSDFGGTRYLNRGIQRFCKAFFKFLSVCELGFTFSERDQKGVLNALSFFGYYVLLGPVKFLKQLVTFKYIYIGIFLLIFIILFISTCWEKCGGY